VLSSSAPPVDERPVLDGSGVIPRHELSLRPSRLFVAESRPGGNHPQHAEQGTRRPDRRDAEKEWKGLRECERPAGWSRRLWFRESTVERTWKTVASGDSWPVLSTSIYICFLTHPHEQSARYMQ